jgi:hypothetical protein
MTTSHPSIRFLLSIPLALSLHACATDDDATDVDDVPLDELAVRCVQSPYDCAPPASDNRAGARVIYDKPSNVHWPLFANTPLYNGLGVQIGTVIPIDTKSGPTAMINYGQRKVIDGQSLVYTWSSHTASGGMSGWIPESKIQNQALLDARSPTTNLPDPGKGDYDAIWLVTGGDNAAYAGLKVDNDQSGSGENATDYMLRPGNVINVTYNVPGFSLGGFSVDSMPVGSIFRRSLGVDEIDIPLYPAGSATPTNKSMHFIYGHIDDGVSRRFGWIAKEALKLDAYDGQAGSWQAFPGSAVDIGSGVKTYCLGTNAVLGGYGVFHWDGTTWNYLTGGGTRIAVDGVGHPWMTNSFGNIFSWNGSAWVVLPGFATDIAVGGNQVWIIGTNAVPGGYGIYHWNGSSWDAAPGGGVRIAVDGSGRPWITNNAGQIFYLDGSSWVPLPGTALDIGIGGNQVWIVSTNRVLGGHGIYHWTGSGWDMVAGGGDQITVDANGHPLLINDNHHIFRRR